MVPRAVSLGVGQNLTLQSMGLVDIPKTRDLPSMGRVCSWVHQGCQKTYTCPTYSLSNLFQLPAFSKQGHWRAAGKGSTRLVR